MKPDKTGAINGDEKTVKQKRVFTFAPQDGLTESVQVEADTIEEARERFAELKSKE